MNYKLIKKEQKRIAKKILTNSEFDEINTIAAIKKTFVHDTITILIAIFSYPDLKLLETKHITKKEPLRYKEDISSFREIPVILETYNLLDNKPDIILVDGDGIINPYLGTASHLGILTEKPTIGIGTKYFNQEIINNRVYRNGDVKGYQIISKEKALPIYISPGHMIGLKRSLDITKEFLKGNKLPTPLHIAHKLSLKIKKEIKNSILDE